MATAGGEATRGQLLEMATIMPSRNQTNVSESLASRDSEMESMGSEAAAAAKNAGPIAEVTKACETSESEPEPRSLKARREPAQDHPATSAAKKYIVAAGKGAEGLAEPMRSTGVRLGMML